MLRSFVFLLALLSSPVWADDKRFTLHVPDALGETGLMQHLLPRFSLKTGIQIAAAEGSVDATFGEAGVPVLRHGALIWSLDTSDDPDAAAFRDWLQSEVGHRTIDAFGEDFSGIAAVANVSFGPGPSGNAEMGEDISLAQCGRCHVVNDTNRMNAIGSTPSFALMRTFPDWEGRFQRFFLLKPHAAFTQVAGVTDPFADNLPSPIAPVKVTLDEIDAIVAYVALIRPADLGAPIQSQ
ncbi:hypothetical protein [Yoonia sp. 2307UL14-13]|uniref:hypothetical protein n=1 Tax=Yoonia sp. 2307UL14-13 TaxID=3126506 RepID=UPI003095F79B